MLPSLLWSLWSLEPSPDHARTPGRQIPDDVWYHVIQFIPPNELWALLNVNRPFFETVMNLKYKEIYLVDMNQRTTRKLIRLKYVSHMAWFYLSLH